VQPKLGSQPQKACIGQVDASAFRMRHGVRTTGIRRSTAHASDIGCVTASRRDNTLHVDRMRLRMCIIMILSPWCRNTVQRTFGCGCLRLRYAANVVDKLVPCACSGDLMHCITFHGRACAPFVYAAVYDRRNSMGSTPDGLPSLASCI
jgi:hypothetical protein